MPSLSASPYRAKDPAKIGAREFLAVPAFQRKQLSLTVANGGVGKSSLCVAEAVTMASGEYLSSGIKCDIRVWLVNVEDDIDEIDRRIQAVKDNYFINDEMLKGKLFVNSVVRPQVSIASSSKEGTKVQTTTVDQFVKQIHDNKIDLVFIDPFVATHSVSENDNMAIDEVARQWIEIARKTNCAVHIVHHARKVDGGEVDAESARGAVSLHDACRYMRTLNRIKSEQNVKQGFLANQNIVKIDIRKSNYSKLEDSSYIELASCTIANGDEVGYVLPVERSARPASPKSSPKSSTNPTGSVAAQAAASATDLQILTQVAGSQVVREDDTHKDWLGNRAAKVLGKDKIKDRQWLIDAVNICLSQGMIIVTTSSNTRGPKFNRLIPTPSSP
ncbi:AAA family ATPase [Bosea sp. R86505]|uniref:AAA family ATPase n=1 Tax=Bosea sp. R86505 TaxID=3101710 RepID=UPI0036704888